MNFAAAVIVLVMCAASVVVLVKFWKRPIFVLSQRGSLVAIVVCIAATHLAALLDASNDKNLCVANSFAVGVGHNMIFTVLTIKEWYAFMINRRIKQQKLFKPIPIIFPLVYFMILLALSIIIELLFWVYPIMIKLGINGCNLSAEEWQSIPANVEAQVYIPLFLGLVNHFACVVMSIIVIRAKSILGDAQTVLRISIIGLASDFFTIAAVTVSGFNFGRYQQQESNSTQAFVFIASTLNFICSFYALISLILRRVAYRKYSAKELVDRFYRQQLPSSDISDLDASRLHKSSNRKVSHAVDHLEMRSSLFVGEHSDYLHSSLQSTYLTDLQICQGPARQSPSGHN